MHCFITSRKADLKRFHFVCMSAFRILSRSMSHGSLLALSKSACLYLSISKISIQSQVSTKQTTSGLFEEQIAASSSILGSKLLQLKSITEKDLLADGLEETGEVTEFKFGLEGDPPPALLIMITVRTEAM